MSVLKIDLWLTESLDRPTYSLSYAPNERIEPQLIDLPPRSFVYTKCPFTDNYHARSLEHAGFNIVETSLTFNKVPSKGNLTQGNPSRLAVPTDEGYVRQIATSCFTFTRFHMDSQIGHPLANALKSEWAGNYFSGTRGQYMVVAEISGKVVGFLQLLTTQDTLIIDLIGVDSSTQRQGIGSSMIKFSEAHFGQFQSIKVGTQAVNIASVRLYENLGFRLIDSSMVFHFHKE